MTPPIESLAIRAALLTCIAWATHDAYARGSRLDVALALFYAYLALVALLLTRQRARTGTRPLPS